MPTYRENELTGREDNIKRYNELGDIDFNVELDYHGFCVIKNSDYDFEIVKGHSKNGKSWDYSIHFFMPDNSKQFSFEYQVNDEKSEIDWYPDEDDDIDIKECIGEWGEYKPEHFRAFVMYMKGNCFA